MVSPLATSAIYLTGRQLIWTASPPDYAALIVVVAIGVLGVVFMPISLFLRFASVIAYVPMASAIVIGWSLIFSCGALGLCA